jgi:2-phospho-L-lactate/phosphoenolpyruvate guanylyltransferase
MALHILIPCKALATGKSRLAPALDAAERAALCTALLEATLDLALQLVPAERCHLVTADRAAADRAAARGARTLAEPPGAGLNPALRLARDAISADASADLLVLPIDLPLASAAALRALLAVAGEAVAAPDRHGLGTNALYLEAAAAPRFDFRFGEASLAAHRAAAEALGLRFSLYEDPALAFDLDRPEDLRDWRDGASAAAAARRP